MRKRLASIGIAVALGVGGLTAAAVNPLGVAGASTTSNPPTITAKPGGGVHANGALMRALRGLVATHKLTQAQADQVVVATKSRIGAGVKARGEMRTAILTSVATTIHSTPAKVLAGLKAGTSIADQGKAANVDRSVLFDSLSKLVTDRLDQGVTNGVITAEQAAKAKTHVPTFVNRLLDAKGSKVGVTPTSPGTFRTPH